MRTDATPTRSMRAQHEHALACRMIKHWPGGARCPAGLMEADEPLLGSGLFLDSARSSKIIAIPQLLMLLVTRIIRRHV